MRDAKCGGERIVARPGEDAYGRLGVLCGWLTEARAAFDIPPQAFTPPPKVTSPSDPRRPPRILFVLASGGVRWSSATKVPKNAA